MANSTHLQGVIMSCVITNRNTLNRGNYCYFIIMITRKEKKGNAEQYYERITEPKRRKKNSINAKSTQLSHILRIS